MGVAWEPGKAAIAFPYSLVPRPSKILVWGWGSVAKSQPHSAFRRIGTASSPGPNPPKIGLGTRLISVLQATERWAGLGTR